MEDQYCNRKEGGEPFPLYYAVQFCFNILELVYGYCYDECGTQIGLVWFKWE